VSLPVVYKDPETGELREVRESGPISVEDVDTRIAETQQHIDHLTAKKAELEALRNKVASFSKPTPAAPAPEPEASAPAEVSAETPAAPATPAPEVPNSAPLELNQNPQEPQVPGAEPPISA